MSRRMTNRDLPQQLLKARDALMSHFRPVLNHFGVTEQQWRILRALDEHERLEPRELCELCQILSPSMAGVLARMEETGLVQRERVAVDARRVMVSLAPKGDALFDRIAPLIERQYRLMEKAWGKDVLDKLSLALAGFVAAQATPVEQVALPDVTREANG